MKTYQEISKNVKTTDEYNKCLEKGKSLWKQLKGTDKQIAFAEKIRSEKTEELAFLLTYERQIIAEGLMGSEKKIEQLKKDYSFIFSEFASKIIENK